jgi:NAD(P)-dependent dehydrogenase (short-subunit alcohol dehydrogenase family)
VQQLRERVAVVTGAASGIGFGLAERFAAEGMKVVLADIEGEPLARAEGSLRSSGAELVAIVTDVSQPDQVDRLARGALDAFGAVHVVCNNAGVANSNEVPIWEASRADWEWVLGVNLLGVINGIRSFVPILLEQDEAHVVNTASIAGLLPGAMGIYSVTKHAVVALSEALQIQLATRGARVGVSVLCPGFVRTRIADADRNRPGRYPVETPFSVDAAARQQWELVRQRVESGTPPSQVASVVVEAIRDERFYVLPHPELLPRVRQRMDDIEHGRPPSPPSPQAQETLETAASTS